MTNLITYHNLAGGNYTQDWSSNSITAVDAWPDGPVIGYLGQDITTVTGADPRTLLTDSAVTTPPDLDVLANQSSTAVTSGGVIEFDGIPNPTIGLQGSGTADAPHLIFFMNATGRENIRLQFNARDIDGTTDNAIQPINVQYRVGVSGPWTNVTNGYNADVTTGPSFATNVTAFDVTLPPAANNQAQLQIRIMTTNAVGSDEIVGIDDISVSSAPLDTTAPLLTGSTPADDALGVAVTDNIVLNFSEAVKLTGNQAAISLFRSSDNSFVERFNNGDIGTRVTIAGSTITLNPTADLTAGTGYYVNFGLDGVRDLAENPFVGNPSPTALNFTTAAAPTATLSVDDVSITEGDSGQKSMTFTISRSNNTTAFSLNATSAAGTATAGGVDFLEGGVDGLSFSVGGVLTQTFNVRIFGDTVVEPDETLTLTLSNLTNTTGITTFAKAVGTGTILNDDLAPAVAISSVSIAEGNAGTQLMTFTATRTGGTAAFNIDYATSDGTATVANSDYAAASGTLSFLVGENSKTFSVTVNGDTALEASEIFNVTLSNATNGATITTAAATGTITNDDFIKISAIQGAAHLSTMVGTIRSIEGIVTGTISTGSVRGYYVQEEEADADADIGTSEGIFVFTGNVSPAVTVGQKVQVTGTVAEFRGSSPAPTANNLATTQFTNATVSVISSGNTLPSAILVGDTGRNPVSTTLGDDPETGVFNPATEATDFWESLEGMRVTIDNPKAAGPFRSNFGEIVVLANGGENDGSLNTRGSVTIRDTTPGIDNPALKTFDFNGERIQIDDGLDGGSTAALTGIKTGDAYADITGIVNYAFGAYEVNVADALSTQTPSALTKETTTIATAPGTLRMASFNVENLSPVGTEFSTGQFTTQAKLDGLAASIIGQLGSPDIVALQEVQDNDGILSPATSTVTSASLTLTQLLAAIAAAGGPAYVAVDAPPRDDLEGGAPGGNIRVSYLYNPATVKPLTALSDVTANVKQYTGPRIGEGNADFAATRLSLPFEWTTASDALQVGSSFWTVNNHFSSKGGSGALFGAQAEGPLWDEPVNGTATRREGQAIAVNAFIDSVLGNANGLDNRVLALGDFNDFQFFPVADLVAGKISRSAAGTATTPSTFATEAQVLRSLMEKLPEAERYTYNFDGNAQALDHIMVSTNLYSSTDLDIVHINAEFNANDRLSDHDPSVVRFLSPTSSALATAGNDTLSQATYTAAYGAEFGSTRVANSINGLGGNDIIIADGPVSLTSGAESVRRLFAATQNEVPADASWIAETAALQNGAQLQSLADRLTSGTAFQATYGALNGADFVTALYANILHRAANDSGFFAWQDALRSGSLTKAQVVAAFSESAEYQIKADTELHVGQVYRLYATALNRLGDVVGFEAWTSFLDNGKSLSSAALSFLISIEFVTKYGSLDDTGFVTQLYQNALGRAADSAGLADWLGRLGSGVGRAEIVVGIAESQESMSRSKAPLDAYMQYIRPDWNDTITGGAGDDQLTGGHGADRFVFTAGQGGVDTVYGYEAWDRVQLTGFGYTDQAAAQARMTQVGSNVQFNDQGQVINFIGTTLADLQIII